MEKNVYFRQSKKTRFHIPTVFEPSEHLTKGERSLDEFMELRDKQDQEQTLRDCGLNDEEIKIQLRVKSKYNYFRCFFKF